MPAKKGKMSLSSTKSTNTYRKGGPAKKELGGGIGLGGMGGGKPLKANGKTNQLTKAQRGVIVPPVNPFENIKPVYKKATDKYRSMDEQIKWRKEVNKFNKTRKPVLIPKKKVTPKVDAVQPIVKYGGIHIKKANIGKFTATKKATGKSTEELTHSSNPVTKKRAVFAQNAKKWNKK